MTKLFKIKRPSTKTGLYDLESCSAMRCKGPNDQETDKHPDAIGTIGLCSLHYETLENWREKNPPGEFVPKPGGPFDKKQEKTEIVKTDQKIAEEAETKARNVITRLEAIVIHNQASMDRASKLTKAVKDEFKKLDGIRTTATKPLLESKRTIDSWFKPSLDIYKQAEILLKNKISTFIKSQEKAQDKALASGDHEAAATSAQVTTSPGVSAVSKWTYKIEDEEKIPRDYLEPNHTLLRKTAEALKGKAKVPGICFYEDKEMRVR
jgi:hypothetical protein